MSTLLIFRSNDKAEEAVLEAMVRRDERRLRQLEGSIDVIATINRYAWCLTPKEKREAHKWAMDRLREEGWQRNAGNDKERDLFVTIARECS